MKLSRCLSSVVLLGILSSSVFAQGLMTNASKDDWEEINFEFNSNILTDGFPSLLRLAEVLNQNAGYKVQLEGHADRIGSDAYNLRLGERRAEAVREFLLKYGARPNQVTTQTFGERQPKVPTAAARQDQEARFMNRRVFMTVTDEQGRTVAAGGVSDALEGLKELMAAQQKCCDEILKRLDRLNDLADMLKKMAGDNETLRKELAGLRQAHDALDKYVKAQPPPLTRQETTEIVDTRTAEQIERARMPRYSTINVNAGADQSGDLTFTGRGRLFVPFKEQLAFQLQGEYMYWRDRQEGQFDFGLVNRFATRAQAGLFASFKHVNFTGRVPGRNIFTDDPVTQFSQGEVVGNGLLGQASLTLDYLFSRGKVGVFGSKGFLQDDMLNRVATTRPNIFTEYYLRTIDQAGVSATVGMFGDSYVEGNVGYLKSRANADRIGGTARFVFPISSRFAFTLEGGMNETLVSRDNTGRVVAGFQFGNFMRPKDYLEGYNGIRHAVPVDVPRVRYEILTRTVRTGNDAPIADAGPDLIGVEAGEITLDGSGSSDPEGEELTFSWQQVAGPAVSLSGMNMARASFTAEEGQSYGFRLRVRDPQGMESTDTVTVTTTGDEGGEVQIVRFQASPDRVRPGDRTNLDWQVLNAESVTITTLGTVPDNGTRAVTPQATTTYTLTARGESGTVTATTTVVVEAQPRPSFTACTVSPLNITAGESATITYSTANADTVSISGIGNVDASGNRVVTPTETTTYTLTATSPGGTATCAVTVQVAEEGEAPRILSFTANPTTITAGQSSTLSWQVENAQSVQISQLGNVQNSGSQNVSPTTTTTYTLTATNANGTMTATVTVTVNTGDAPTIASCVASPTTVPAGSTAQVTYVVQNASSVTVSPTVSGATLTGFSVMPLATTTYTITATGTQNRTASCTVTVTVQGSGNQPVAIISGGPVIDTFVQQFMVSAQESSDPLGQGLTYIWEFEPGQGTVLDQGQAMTRVQIPPEAGAARNLRLTVRDAAGNTATTTVAIILRSSR